MTVTPEDRDAMAKFLSIMEGKTPPKVSNRTPTSHDVELAGPGQVTRGDIDAMASVINKLNSVSNHVVDSIITESKKQPELSEALLAHRTQDGVKFGRYQILVKEDSKRLAGKQYYSIYNTLTNDVLADDISLYETALVVVRHLNAGTLMNNKVIREIFEQDDAYTSHRIDALRYKRKLAINKDEFKKDLYESRYQASLDRCMAAKKAIKKLAS